MKFFRKIYFYFKLHIYKKMGFARKVFAIVFYVSAFIFFVDKIFVENLLLKNADAELEQSNCQNAMQLYGPLSAYYGIFNLDNTHKQINAKIQHDMGVCYTLSGDKTKGKNYVEAGLMYLEQDYGINSKYVADYLRKYSSEYYLSQKDYAKASFDINQAYATYQKLRLFGNETADALRLYGDINFAQHNYDNAIFYYQKSFDMFNKTFFIDYDDYTKAAVNMANYYILKQDSENAIATYTIALKMLTSSKINSDKCQALVLKNLADIYYSKEDFKNAKKYYEQAIDLIKGLPKYNPLRQNLMVTKGNLAESYHNTNDFQKESDLRDEMYREKIKVEQ